MPPLRLLPKTGRLLEFRTGDQFIAALCGSVVWVSPHGQPRTRPQQRGSKLVLLSASLSCLLRAQHREQEESLCDRQTSLARPPARKAPLLWCGAFRMTGAKK